MMLTEGVERMTVLDGEGRPKGTVRLDTITGLIGPEKKDVVGA